MIELNKLNGMSIFVNPDLIRIVESTPDTLVNFTDGESLLVLNSPQDIIAKIILFRRQYSFQNSDHNLEPQK
jgi:flagellar protein FlbD